MIKVILYSNRGKVRHQIILQYGLFAIFSDKVKLFDALTRIIHKGVQYNCTKGVL